MVAIISFSGVTTAQTSPKEVVRSAPDAKMYAADYNVSLQEATRRLRLQDRVGALRVALETNEADTFSGLYILHEPEYRIVARFTRAGNETIRRYANRTPVADLVEVVPAQATRAQLEATQAKCA